MDLLAEGAARHAAAMPIGKRKELMQEVSAEDLAYATRLCCDMHDEQAVLTRICSTFKTARAHETLVKVARLVVDRNRRLASTEPTRATYQLRVAFPQTVGAGTRVHFQTSAGVLSFCLPHDVPRGASVPFALHPQCSLASVTYEAVPVVAPACVTG